MRRPSEYDKAYSKANTRAAAWVRVNHPQVFEQLLVQALAERGLERRGPGRPR